MSATPAVADQSSESFPAYEGRMHYIEGYDPVSYEAPHSSIMRTSTWVGMGLLLAAVGTSGILIWSLARLVFGSEGIANPSVSYYLILGAVITAVFVIGGALLIHRGRRYYRQYRAETGRVN